MPGFIHRLFGRDSNKATKELSGGPTLWDKGSPDSWYYYSKSSGISFKKWWARSLPAHIGLELFLYLVCYYMIHLIYKFGLDDSESDISEKSSKKEFENIVKFFDKTITPLSKDLTFLLGFYVSQIVRRWWDRFKILPNPDSLVLLAHGLVDFTKEHSMVWAKKMMRYVILAYVLCLRRISKSIQKQFPNNKSLISNRLATRMELLQMEAQGDLGRVWWIPISWVMTMIRNSKEDKVIAADQKILIDAVRRFQDSLEDTDNYDHIIFPPLYKQVVKFAVYVYFGLSLIASQELDDNPYTFIPIFLILKFVFFFGWLEVAEAIANPFGDDEDDFQICELISRHVWAVSRNLNQFRGPPKEDGEDQEEEEEEEEGKKHVVSLLYESAYQSMILKKNKKFLPNCTYFVLKYFPIYCSFIHLPKLMKFLMQLQQKKLKH